MFVLLGKAKNSPFLTRGSDAGEGENFFSREKSFSPSPTPLSLFKKSGIFNQGLFGQLTCALHSLKSFSKRLPYST
jgi:hypothetical protein